MFRFFFVALSCFACFVLLAWSLSIQHIGQGHEGIEESNVSFRSPKGTVYVIRHGEKPDDGRRGLSRMGRKRAECVLNLFGPQSGMDISYIIAAPTVGRVRNSRSIDTVKPLAEALNIEIDSDCGGGNAKCVAKRVKEVQKTALDEPVNVLIVGRHTKIRKIVKALGVKNPPKYPDAYGLTWQVKDSKLQISQQDCPRIDGLQTSLDPIYGYTRTGEDEDDADESIDGSEMDEDDPEFTGCNLDDGGCIHEHRPTRIFEPEQSYLDDLH